MFFLLSAFLILPLIPSYTHGGKLRCKKLVVDTVGAMEEMRGIVDIYNSLYKKNIEDLKKNPGNEEKIEWYRNNLFNMPDTFSSDAWYELLLDSDMTALKSIDYEREAEGEDCQTFRELVDKYFPSEKDKLIFQNEWSVVGKFDGLIKDRIGIFPVAKGSNQNPIGAWCQTTGFGPYNEVLLKSMWETVPSLTIPLGFETKDQAVRLNLCSYCWDGSKKKHDGLNILVFNSHNGISQRYFFYHDGKKWRQSMPEMVECMTYEECVRKAKEMRRGPVILKGKCYEENSEGEVEFNYSFLVASDELVDLFGHNRNTILKYETVKDGEVVTGNCYLAMPEYLGIFVENNYEDSGNDVIVVEYFEYNDGDRDRKRNVYLPVRDYSDEMKGPMINGRVFDYSVYLKKIAEWKLNYTTDKWFKNEPKWWR